MLELDRGAIRDADSLLDVFFVDTATIARNEVAVAGRESDGGRIKTMSVGKFTDEWGWGSQEGMGSDISL